MKVTNTKLMLVAVLGLGLNAHAGQSLSKKENPMLSTTDKSKTTTQTETVETYSNHYDNIYSSKSLDEAVEKGKLSKNDADLLKQDYQKIDNMKKDANKDGYMSNTEQDLIKKEQDKYTQRVQSRMK